MPDFDPYSIQLADEPTALEMAKARAAALRGQNFAGTVLGLAHDPNAARMGGALMQQAQQGQEQLGQAPGERIRQLLGRQQLQTQQREAAPFTDPAQAGILAQGQQAAAKMMGVNIPEGATPTTGQLFLSAFEKPYEQQQNRLMREALARTSANARLQVAGVGPGGGGTLSPEAIDQWAQLGVSTGAPPPRSIGPANVRAVLNRMSELSPQASLAENKAGFKASQGSLGKLQMQADSIQSFEETALKNLDNFRDIAKQVVDVHSPLFNQPMRTVMNKLAGDPRQAQFNAARQVAIQEVGKVLGGAVSGGAISDSQRHEVESLLGPDATLAQIESVSNTLKQDMANRKTAVANQLAEIHGRLGGKAAVSAMPAAQGEDADAIAWAKANASDPRAQKILALHGGAK